MKSITLHQEAATIGRNAGNTLVLDDPQRYISGHHAFIDFRESNYFVTDASTNGVLINDAQQALGNGNSVPLHDGDRLHIGQYTITVSLLDAPADILQGTFVSDTDALSNDPFADLNPVAGVPDTSDITDSPLTEPKVDLFDLPEVTPINAGNDAIETGAADDIFADDWFKSHDNSASAKAKELFTDDFFADLEGLAEADTNRKTGTQVSHDDLLSQPDELAEDPFPDDFFSNESPSDGIDTTQLANPEATVLEPLIEQEPVLVDLPVIEPEQTSISSHFDLPQKQPAPSPTLQAKSSAESVDAQVLIEHFLRGAGLENAGIDDALTPEKFFIIGTILRASVQGTMDVLSGRAKIKNEMHLDVTMIRAVQNNPVKFSVGAEEAIRKMLVPQDKGYLPAEEAIDEVFDDIRAHQFSVIAGMQTALLEVLKRFDPEKLEHRLQQQNPIAASIPIHKQAKLWRLFARLYDDIESEATDNFYHLFGQAFAESYEEQIIKLKESKRNT